MLGYLSKLKLYSKLVAIATRYRTYKLTLLNVSICSLFYSRIVQCKKSFKELKRNVHLPIQTNRKLNT